MTLKNIYVTVRLTVQMVEGVETGTLLNEMDYEFTPQPEHGKLVDSEILTGGEEAEYV